MRIFICWQKLFFGKMRDLLTIIFLVIISGCTRTNNSDLTTFNVDSLSTSDKVTLDSLDFNVIKYDTSYSYIFPTKFKAIDLSDEEIIQCETLLKSFMVGYNAEAIKRFNEMTEKYPSAQFKLAEFKIELKNYGRQYMTVVSDNGDKIVYVNCFCNPAHFNYRDKELVHVDDGGNCFFNFKVDLRTKKIFEFMENGVA
jgi:hypothetical protein